MYTDVKLQGEKIYDKEAVLNYIDNLLSIKVGELPFNRKFGSYLEEYLFEPYTFLNAKSIELEIYRAISTWLPMVTIKDINVEFDPDSEEYKITVILEIEKIQQIINYEKKLQIKGK